MHSARTTNGRHRAVAAVTKFLAIGALLVPSACGADEFRDASGTLDAEVSAATASTVPFADFVDMYFYMPDDRRSDGVDRANDVVHGIVEINGTCLYLHQLETWGDGDLYRDDSGAVHTYVLALPYTLTRYDPATQSLWYDRKGPIADGDQATAYGWLHESDQPSETCPSANGRKLSGELVPGLAEILCKGDGVGISGVMPGAGENQPCV